MKRFLLLIGLTAGIWIGMSAVAHASEACFTASINSERSARGIPTLSVDSRLVDIARRHSGRMASQGTIFHNSNLPNEAPPEWQALGENVGMGGSCASIHRAFMNSSSHAANILDTRFNFVGVGVVTTSDGTIYVTEVFMKAPTSQPAPAPAPTQSSTTSSSPSGSSSATQPAPRAAAPAPSPPPPPGSKITQHHKALLDLLDDDDIPTEEQREEHRLLLAEKTQGEIEALNEQFEAPARKRDLFAHLASFLSAVLSGAG